MSKATHSSEKIEEALQLLREAADDKKSEIQSLLEGKYSDLRDSVLDVEGMLAEKVAQLGKKAGRAADKAEKKARAFASDIDEQVHEDPWRVVGWTAVAALVLGYILGRKD